MLIVYFSPAVSLRYVNLFIMIKSDNNSHQKHNSTVVINPDPRCQWFFFQRLLSTLAHLLFTIAHHTLHTSYSQTPAQKKEQVSSSQANKMHDNHQSRSHSVTQCQQLCGTEKQFCGKLHWVLLLHKDQQIHTHTRKHTNKEKQDWGWSGEKGRNREVSKARMGDHDMSLVSSVSFDSFSFCSLYFFFFLNYKKTACTASVNLNKHPMKLQNHSYSWKIGILCTWLCDLSGFFVF